MKKFFKRFASAGRSRPVEDDNSERVNVAVLPVISHETRDEEMPDAHPTTSLERLPSEIQSAILMNICDITSLKNLVHASSSYHSAYLSQRHAILERVLFNSIHPDVLYDAFAAITSYRTLTSNFDDRLARVNGFLAEYRDNRDKWTPPQQLGPESTVRLARLQNQVQHATADFCQVASLSHPFTSRQLGPSDQLSSNEIRRFHRAFYRFEIFCTLFRNWKNPSYDGRLSDASEEDGDTASEFDSMEKSDCFLSLFLPWEVEELACVRDFFYNYYRRMIQKFARDLCEIRSDLDLSEDAPFLEDNIEYLMALSLRFYRRIETSPPERQVRYLNYGLRIGSDFLSEALKQPPQAAVHQYMTTDDPAELHFEGDSVRDGPNMMWLWVSGDKMNFDWYDRLNEPLREWGYVFWDQERLAKWGVPDEEYETWTDRRRAGLRKALAEQSL